MKKIRVAFIGMAHIHLGQLSFQLYQHKEDFEFVGVADYYPESQEQFETHIKLNKAKDVPLDIWDDYKELLKQDIDVAVVCTDVRDHVAATEEILGMGIHVVLEKPMALSMEGAKRMYRAHKKSKGELIVNWPIAWFASFRKAKELAQSGVIGEIQRVQYRSPSTRGPYKLNEYTPEELSKLWWYQSEKGGGSICDYAGYGCVIATWITGKVAKKVYGIKKNFFLPFSDVEDYSQFTIDFGDCVGLIEGSWSTMNNGEIPTGPVIYGSEGVIVADRFTPEVKVYKDLIPYQPSPEPNEVYVPEDMEESLGTNLIGLIREGKPVYEMLSADFNMKVMSAFDAGIRSCNSGVVEMAEEPFQF